MPIKAAVYVRISRDSQGEGLGVARQLQACRDMAAAKGWEIDDAWILNENDVSAVKSPRPLFERLLKGMESGQVQAVLAFKVDRLMRRLDDMVRLWDVAKRRNVLVTTVSGELDLTTPTGRSNAMLWGVLAAIEIENLRDRLERKALQSVNAGRNANGGSRPFGWDSTRTQHVLEEAEIIRDAAARLIDGESLTSVAKDLNRRGIRTAGWTDRLRKAEQELAEQRKSDPDAGPLQLPPVIPWDVRKLSDVLSNERHAGRVEHRGKVVLGPDGQPVKAQWEPILEPDVFDRLQAAIAARRQVSDAWTGERRHLLSGTLLRCGFEGCGQRLLPDQQTGGAYAYRHRGHVSRNRDHVDRIVLAAVIKRADENPIEVTSWERAERADLSVEIERVERQLSNLEDQFLQHGGDAARLARMTATLDAQLQTLKAERLDMLEFETGVRWASFDMSEMLAESASLLPNDDPNKSQAIEEQRSAIRMYVQRIVIHPTKMRGNRFDESSVKIVWRDVNRLRWRATVEA